MVRGPGDDLLLTGCVSMGNASDHLDTSSRNLHAIDYIYSELDANGRDSTRTLVIDGKVAFHEIHTYNDDANIVRLDLRFKVHATSCSCVSSFTQPLVQSDYGSLTVGLC